MNKLWNVGKYISLSLNSLSEVEKRNLAVVNTLTESELLILPLPERFICSRCHEVCDNTTKYLDSYLFSEALKLISDFFWDEFADWYVEVSLFVIFSFFETPQSYCCINYYIR